MPLQVCVFVRVCVYVRVCWCVGEAVRVCALVSALMFRSRSAILIFTLLTPHKRTQVPKKTRLYIEQTKREMENAPDMHRIFQRDLAKLKLTAARTYVKLLTDGKVRVCNG